MWRFWIKMNRLFWGLSGKLFQFEYHFFVPRPGRHRWLRFLIARVGDFCWNLGYRCFQHGNREALRRVR